MISRMVIGKVNFLCLVAFTIGVFTGCTGSDDPDNPANFPNLGQLQVKATLYSVSNGSAWNTNEQIGLFVCSNTADMSYDQVEHKNVLCTGQGADNYWHLEQDIQLTSGNNTVFAYYPYKPEAANLKKIDIDLMKMEDVCFGVNDQQTILNRTQPIAIIPMRHALAKIRFNLILDKTEEYFGPGIIEDARVVKIAPDSTVDETRNTVLTILGTLDATTGRINTVTSGKMPIKKLVGKTFAESGIEEDKMPFFYSTPESYMKDYAFAVVVDGKQHILCVDKGTEWRAATINTYTLRLKGKGLIIDQSDDNGFDVKPWEDCIENEIDY